MSGDKLDIKVDYYIPTATTDNSAANGLNSIISSLTTLINNDPVTTPLHGSGGTIITALNSSTPFTSFLAPENGTAGTTLPKAYLNIVFFDEQFKFVSQNSEVVQVTSEGSGQTIYRLGGSAKTATKNGFVYIYVSNESNNLVYFDNLQITHEHGPLVQEDHYYPYGLGMADISSSAISGIVANAYKANGGTELGSGEWADGKGLELYETTYRSFDAQIGRFMQVDPEMESSANFSGYAFGADNPVFFNDPLGLRNHHKGPKTKSNGGVGHYEDHGKRYVCSSCGPDEAADNSTEQGGDGNGIDDSAGDGGGGGGGGVDAGVWESFVQGGDGFSENGGGDFGTNESDNYHSSGNGGSHNGKNMGSSTNYQPGDGITPQNIKKIKEGLISGEAISLTFELGANATRGFVTVSTKNGLIKISATAAQYANLAKAFSNLGKAATVVEMYNSYHEYNNGEIGGGRLAYRLTGGSACLLSDMLANALLDGELGTEAGPWGAVIGIVVGVATPLGEIFYDKVLVPAADKTKDWMHEFIIDPIASFESSLDNWHP